jgi:hypothetical protein
MERFSESDINKIFENFVNITKCLSNLFDIFGGISLGELPEEEKAKILDDFESVRQEIIYIFGDLHILLRSCIKHRKEGNE